MPHNTFAVPALNVKWIPFSHFLLLASKFLDDFFNKTILRLAFILRHEGIALVFDNTLLPFPCQKYKHP